MKQVELPDTELEPDKKLGEFDATEHCDEMLDLIDAQLNEFGLEIEQCVNVGDTNLWWRIVKR